MTHFGPLQQVSRDLPVSHQIWTARSCQAPKEAKTSKRKTSPPSARWKEVVFSWLISDQLGLLGVYFIPRGARRFFQGTSFCCFGIWSMRTFSLQFLAQAYFGGFHFLLIRSLNVFFQGSLNFQCFRVVLRDFPLQSALFGLVSYNDPCLGLWFFLWVFYHGMNITIRFTWDWPRERRPRQSNFNLERSDFRHPNLYFPWNEQPMPWKMVVMETMFFFEVHPTFQGGFFVSFREGNLQLFPRKSH